MTDYTETKTSGSTKEVVETSAVTVYETYHALVVTDKDSLREAGHALTEIKEARKRLREVFKPMIDAQKAALKGVRVQYGRFDDPLVECEKNVKHAMGSYMAEQDRIAKEEARAAEEAARKKAEDERLKEAELLEAEGKTEEAEQVIEQPPVVVPKRVPMKTTTEGAHTRTIWKAEVLDLMTLVKAIANGDNSIDFIKANTVALNDYARYVKEERIETGIRIYPETIVAARS